MSAKRSTYRARAVGVCAVLVSGAVSVPAERWLRLTPPILAQLADVVADLVRNVTLARHLHRARKVAAHGEHRQRARR